MVHKYDKSSKALQQLSFARLLNNGSYGFELILQSLQSFSAGCSSLLSFLTSNILSNKVSISNVNQIFRFYVERIH